MRLGNFARAFALSIVTFGLNAVAPAQWLENPPRFPAPFYNGMNPVSFFLPAVQIDASNFRMQVLNGRVPFPAPGAQINSFFDVFAEFDLRVGGNTGHATSNGAGVARATNAGSFFDTEMLQLSLTGSSPFGPLMIRESPTLPSLGRASVQQQGTTFLCDSFFDVFTELSIDGGQTWSPATGPMRIVGTPEPASMIAMAAGLSALAVRRRRRRA